MDNAMAQTILDLEPPLRERVSSIRIERASDHAGWQMRVSYYLYVAGELVDGRLPHHVATLDTRDMPAGVRVHDTARWPDSVHPLPSLHGADPQAAVQAMVAMLDASGVAGRLDVARHEAATIGALTVQPWPSWTIRTHAGSDAERAAWLRSLNV